MDIRKHSRTNRLQSVMMILSLALILGVCGYLLLGWLGVWLALGVALFILISTGKASAQLVLRMYRAQLIEPHQAPGLVNLFEALATRAQLPVIPKLYIVPSRMMNAFATGRGDQVAVAVTDGLLRNMDAREIAGVLAHEISHIKNDDVFTMTLADSISRVTAFIGQAGLFMLLAAIPSAILGYGFPWLAGVVLLFAPSISALIQLALSRSREYDADETAAMLTGDPIGLAMALKKIEFSQGNWLQKIFMPGRRVPEPAMLRTHPPTQERIDKLKQMAGIDPGMRLPVPDGLVAHFDGGRIIRPPRWHLTGLWY